MAVLMSVFLISCDVSLDSVFLLTTPDLVVNNQAVGLPWSMRIVSTMFISQGCSAAREERKESSTHFHVWLSGGAFISELAWFDLIAPAALYYFRSFFNRLSVRFCNPISFVLTRFQVPSTGTICIQYQGYRSWTFEKINSILIEYRPYLLGQF